MAKKIVVLSGSPGKGGNSELLCDQFIPCHGQPLPTASVWDKNGDRPRYS